MRTRLPLVGTWLGLVAAVALGACGSDDDPGGATAPPSIAGQVYDLTIASGNGAFASEGTLTVTFSATDNRYASLGDGVNVGDSAGTYSYSAAGDRGIVAIDDSAVGFGRYELTFTGSDIGSFAATIEADPGARQNGTFAVR